MTSMRARLNPKGHLISDCSIFTSQTYQVWHKRSCCLWIRQWLWTQIWKVGTVMRAREERSLLNRWFCRCWRVVKTMDMLCTWRSFTAAQTFTYSCRKRCCVTVLATRKQMPQDMLSRHFPLERRPTQIYALWRPCCLCLAWHQECSFSWYCT